MALKSYKKQKKKELGALEKIEWKNIGSRKCNAARWKRNS